MQINKFMQTTALAASIFTADPAAATTSYAAQQNTGAGGVIQVAQNEPVADQVGVTSSKRDAFIRDVIQSNKAPEVFSFVEGDARNNGVAPDRHAVLQNNVGKFEVMEDASVNKYYFIYDDETGRQRSVCLTDPSHINWARTTLSYSGMREKIIDSYLMEDDNFAKTKCHIEGKVQGTNAISMKCTEGPEGPFRLIGEKNTNGTFSSVFQQLSKPVDPSMPVLNEMIPLNGAENDLAINAIVRLKELTYNPNAREARDRIVAP